MLRVLTTSISFRTFEVGFGALQMSHPEVRERASAVCKEKAATETQWQWQSFAKWFDNICIWNCKLTSIVSLTFLRNKTETIPQGSKLAAKSQAEAISPKSSFSSPLSHGTQRMHRWGRSAGRTAQTSCEHMEIIAGPGKSLLLSMRWLITCSQLEIKQTPRCSSHHLLPLFQKCNK